MTAQHDCIVKHMHTLQTEALQQKTDEAQHIREKVVSMELSLHNTSEEKGQYEV